MSITPGGVHDEASRVLSNSLCESGGSFLYENVAPTLLARSIHGNRLIVVVCEGRDDDIALELGFADLTLDRGSVDCEISKVLEELLGSVLRANEVEELWRVIDEGGPALAVDESRVSKEGTQERNIGLDTADTELDERTKHLSAGTVKLLVKLRLTRERGDFHFESGPVHTALDQHAVVVGSDDCLCWVSGPCVMAEI